MSKRTEITIKATVMMFCAMGLAINLAVGSWGMALMCLSGMYATANG